MSESNRSRPGVEVLLLGLVVAGALLAWLSRGSMPKSVRPPGVAPAPVATDSPGWTTRASRPRRRIPFSGEAIARAEKLCVTMAQSQIGFALHDSVTAELTDEYAVGDPETGAGDSTIMEGVAHLSSGKLSDFRCTGPNLTSYPAMSYVEHQERQ